MQIFLIFFRFSDEEVKFISSRGNKLVNQKFEKYLPKYYHRPDFNDPPLIRGLQDKAIV